MKTAHPLVSISCITYNHAEFIRECIDSLLSQKTTFAFEILIHDDASTDGTSDIIREYQHKYPEIIKPIIQTENQYTKGVRGINLRFNFSRAKGKYIALCEGDDYWTDDTKLQRQVDFLEANQDYAVVFHPVKVHFHDESTEDVTFPENTRNITLKRLLEENYIQTNTVMYRAQKNYEQCETDILPGDWYLHLYHAQFGKIGMIRRVMSVYRRHSGGVWWGSIEKEAEFIKNIFTRHLKLFYEVRRMFGDTPSHLESINKAENKFVRRAIQLNTDDEEFLCLVAKQAPAVVGAVLHGLYKTISELEIHSATLATESEQRKQAYDQLYQSRTYQTGKAVLGPARYVKGKLNGSKRA